jgi:hypothetical protein
MLLRAGFTQPVAEVAIRVLVETDGVGVSVVDRKIA